MIQKALFYQSKRRTFAAQRFVHILAHPGSEFRAKRARFSLYPGSARHLMDDTSDITLFPELDSFHICVYDKEPRAVALKQFAVFNIQLPCFPKAPEDYSKPLYCWCKLLYEMHFSKKLPTEVFEMGAPVRLLAHSRREAGMERASHPPLPSPLERRRQRRA
jgi:hypothetical protein